MAEQKIFAGPRIRRIRNAKGLTQTAMAEGLGISPSYLNLIERNQRPLTVQLILKLASVYKVDPDELQGEARGSVAALEGSVFRPAAGRRIAGRPGTDRDRRGGAQCVGRGDKAVSRLSRTGRAPVRPRRNCWRAKVSATALSGARLPIDEVREVFERRPNHFASIEAEAEAFTSVLDPGDDLFARPERPG